MFFLHGVAARENHVIQSLEKGWSSPNPELHMNFVCVRHPPSGRHFKSDNTPSSGHISSLAAVDQQVTSVFTDMDTLLMCF